jgi:hypothetical protein
MCCVVVLHVMVFYVSGYDGVVVLSVLLCCVVMLEDDARVLEGRWLGCWRIVVGRWSDLFVPI